MEIREALEDVEIAFRQLEFAIKLLSFCELGNISPKEFDADQIVYLDDGNLHFPTGHFNDADSLNRAASISVLMAFSASVCILDNAFEAIGVTRDPEATDHVGKLRALIYMVRCAQAHRIADPHWEARGKFARTITVDLGGTELSLDLKALHGQRFHIDQGSADMGTGIASVPLSTGYLVIEKPSQFLPEKA
jgi:hypothetical protein